MQRRIASSRSLRRSASLNLLQRARNDSPWSLPAVFFAPAGFSRFMCQQHTTALAVPQGGSLELRGDGSTVTLDGSGCELIDITAAAEISLHPSSLKQIPVQAWFDETGQFIILEGESMRARVWDATTGLPVTPVFQSEHATNEEDYRNIRLA